VVDLWHRAQKKIGQWMQGQLLLSLLYGVPRISASLSWAVPYALLLAHHAAISTMSRSRSFLQRSGDARRFHAGASGLHCISRPVLSSSTSSTHLIYPLV